MAGAGAGAFAGAGTAFLASTFFGSAFLGSAFLGSCFLGASTGLSEAFEAFLTFLSSSLFLEAQVS